MSVSLHRRHNASQAGDTTDPQRRRCRPGLHSSPDHRERPSVAEPRIAAGKLAHYASVRTLTCQPPAPTCQRASSTGEDDALQPRGVDYRHSRSEQRTPDWRTSFSPTNSRSKQLERQAHATAVTAASARGTRLLNLGERPSSTGREGRHGRPGATGLNGGGNNATRKVEVAVRRDGGLAQRALRPRLRYRRPVMEPCRLRIRLYDWPTSAHSGDRANRGRLALDRHSLLRLPPGVCRIPAEPITGQAGR